MVISYTVRYNTTETPEGWAEFIFEEHGTVSQKVTRQEMQASHHGNMHWQAEGNRITIYEGSSPTWFVKFIGDTDLVLSQGSKDGLSYRLRKV